MVADFGPVFRDRIAATYSYIVSVARVNWYQSELFNVMRSVRQWCHLLSLLHVLAHELILQKLEAFRSVQCERGRGRNCVCVGRWGHRHSVEEQVHRVGRHGSKRSVIGSKFIQAHSARLYLDTWRSRPMAYNNFVGHWPEGRMKLLSLVRLISLSGEELGWGDEKGSQLYKEMSWEKAIPKDRANVANAYATPIIYYRLTSHQFMSNETCYALWKTGIPLFKHICPRCAPNDETVQHARIHYMGIADLWGYVE